MKNYARLCPADLAAADREEYFRLLDDMDEDGMEKFFQRVPVDQKLAHVLRILKEARELGDRLSVLDRTLPTLPHVEIAECYQRLRVLGDQVGDLEATGILR
jgi:hypothetical protein